MRRRMIMSIVAWLLLAIFGGRPLSAAEPAKSEALSSWNDGPSKKAIIDFVDRVTRDSGPDYVKPADRIATFDHDGTLWAEQPMYFQIMFAMDRVRALAPKHPDWKNKQPFKGGARPRYQGVGGTWRNRVSQDHGGNSYRNHSG